MMNMNKKNQRGPTYEDEERKDNDLFYNLNISVKKKIKGEERRKRRAVSDNMCYICAEVSIFWGLPGDPSPKKNGGSPKTREGSKIFEKYKFR